MKTKFYEKYREALRRPGFPSFGDVLRRRRRTIDSFLQEKGVTDEATAQKLLNLLAASITDFSFEDDFFEALDRTLKSLEEKAANLEQEITPQIPSENEGKKKKAKVKNTEEDDTQESLDSVGDKGKLDIP